MDAIYAAKSIQILYRIGTNLFKPLYENKLFTTHKSHKFSEESNSEEQMIENYTNEIEMLNICGGIPIDYPNSYLLTIDAGSDFFELNLDTPEHQVVRLWQLRENSIYNNVMKVYSTGSGVGKKIFINQIIQSRKLGIVTFTVSAAKSDDYNGYYTWARMGYSFYDPSEITEFKDLMKNHGRSENDIIELMETPAGRKFWKENGFWWEGFFDITSGSKNIKALNIYLAYAGEKFSL